MKFEKFVMPSHVWDEVDDQLALEGNIWVNNIYERGMLIFNHYGEFGEEW